MKKEFILANEGANDFPEVNVRWDGVHMFYWHTDLIACATCLRCLLLMVMTTILLQKFMMWLICSSTLIGSELGI